MGELVRREGVPILSTGTFLLSTGQHTFTEEDLKSAVDALNDPAVKLPRIKIDGLAASFDPAAHGGEPAFGYVDNLRLAAAGQTLIGDYVIPDWLDPIIDWAYPSRSIEGPPRGWVSATGRTHDLVITAVALLGVDLPAVETLPDLKDLLANGPKSTDAPVEVLARMADPAQLKAGLDQDIVRSRFVDQLESGDINLPEGADPWAWWPSSIRIDDDNRPYMIAKDEAEGRVYRVDFTVAGNEVTFSDPVEQVVQYVAASSGTKPHRQVAVWASRAESRPSHPNPKEESFMDPKELRESIGLAEDASDEDVKARLAELNARPESDEAEVISLADHEAKVEEAVAAARAEETAKIAASAGKVPEGMSLVPTDTLEELKARQQRADEFIADAEKRDHEHQRTEVIADALRGKIPLAAKAKWEERYDRDPEGTKDLLAGMPRLLPTDGDEIGVTGGLEASAQIPDGDLPDGLSLLTPAERAQRA